MFQAIANAAAFGKITLTIEKMADGKLKVLFLQAAEKDNPVAIPPRFWTDTPQELDAVVASEISELAAHRSNSVAVSLSEAKQLMDEAAAAEKKAAAEKAESRKGGVTKVTSRPGAKSKPAPTLNASQDADDTPTGSESGSQESGGESGGIQPGLAASEGASEASTDSLFD